MPIIFQEVYGQSTGVAGLHYIALGLGMCIASQGNSRLVDRIYLYLAKTRGHEGLGRPEFRLRE